LLALIISVVALDSKVSPMCCKNSLHWHLVDEEEWSINEKTELLVETLSLLLEVFDVDDSPFLVETSMLWISNNFLSFKIFS
jgi:hypothetical protein